MPMPVTSMEGLTFGRLTVLRREGTKGRFAAWLCRCECGTEKVIDGSSLRLGDIKSCGCLRRSGQQAVRHGHKRIRSRTPTYSSWSAMRDRVLRGRGKNAIYYRLRGITICAEWNSFEQFLADMGERPAGTTLDRIDTNGPYAPWNCRWATPKEQAANRRRVFENPLARLITEQRLQREPLSKEETVK